MGSVYGKFMSTVKSHSYRRFIKPTANYDLISIILLSYFHYLVNFLNCKLMKTSQSSIIKLSLSLIISPCSFCAKDYFK